MRARDGAGSSAHTEFVVSAVGKDRLPSSPVLLLLLVPVLAETASAAHRLRHSSSLRTQEEADESRTHRCEALGSTTGTGAEEGEDKWLRRAGSCGAPYRSVFTPIPLQPNMSGRGEADIVFCWKEYEG